ncbi:MAG: LptE family protein [Bacteroidales bacterium]
MKKTSYKYIIITALITAVFVSCTISYKFNGASVDYNNTKTISIADFPIRAALVYPPLASVFNEALQDIYTRQTRLSIVKRNGDLQVEGEITGYNLTPQAVKADAYASQTRLTISVRVKYTDTKNPNFNIDQTFSAYRDFDSSLLLTQVQDDLITQITKELADIIFNATVANW